MVKPKYAAVDWGTSNLRIWLVDENDRVLAEQRDIQGMSIARNVGFSTVLETHLSEMAAPIDLPVIACGMVGAKQGWIEAPYVTVPTGLSAIHSSAVKVPRHPRDIRILPGLAQRSASSPDVMRGEETLLLGALRSHPEGETLICLPGTHSKWVCASDGEITAFSTFMTGEMFDILIRHSILSHATASDDQPALDDSTFATAVSLAYNQPASVTNYLFTVRSGQLLFGLTKAGAQARISGTLIGLELAGARSGFATKMPVVLIASGHLRRLYELAFKTLNITFITVDAESAVRAGLSIAAGAIWPLMEG